MWVTRPDQASTHTRAHLVVVRENAPQELALRFGLRLDHELAVVAVEEEGARLAVAGELDVLVRAAERLEVLLLVDVEALPQLVEDGGGVVLELEGAGQLVRRRDGRPLRREHQLVHLHEVVQLQVVRGLRHLRHEGQGQTTTGWAA